MRREKRGRLNLLLIQQAYLVKKLQMGNIQKLKELKEVQLQINAWYQEESQKVKIQSKMDEINKSEKVTVYHHDLHSKYIKKSSILTLSTEEDGILEGHEACANYLEKNVEKILSGPANLDINSQRVLLNETQQVFTT